MKIQSATEYIVANGLCKGVGEKSGIYAITLDNRVVYVGQARNMIRRAKMHFRFALNIPVRHKYYLLQQAIKNKQPIDCVVLKECECDKLNELEENYINIYKHKERKYPPLNKLLGQNPANFPYEKFIQEMDNYAPRS